MKFVLFAHGGSGNHGCEALVRSTCKIIHNKYREAEILVATHNKTEDLKYGVEGVKFVEYGVFSAKNPMKYIDKIVRVLFKSGIFRKSIIKPIIKELKKEDVCLSIGGDNYSYEGVVPFDILGVHKEAKKIGCRTILWGCSINQNNLCGKILNDLRQYDCIVARESITYQNLLDAGIEKEKVKLSADPAFLLDSVKVPSSKEALVGINLSPVVLEEESRGGIVLDNYYNLIQYIIDNTQYNITLIPHVIWPNSNDMIILKRVYASYKNTGRVQLLEDMSATKLKGAIGSCTIFVGARTHATIAAYSQGIPTLVLGYSVKARGIAKDLFGTEEGYVVSTQNLKTKDDLKNAFINIDSNKEKIHQNLLDIMEQYKEKAMNAGEYLFESNDRRNC